MGNFRIGAVISDSFAILRKAPLAYFGVQILLYTLPMLLVSRVMFDPTIFVGGDPKALLQKLPQLGSVCLVMIIIAYLIAAYYALVTHDVLRGQTPQIGASLATSVRKLPKLILNALAIFTICLLFVLAMAILVGGFSALTKMGADSRSAAGAAAIVGFIFVLILLPLFIYLCARFGFVIQAIAVDNQGPLKAFARSSGLTKGRRSAVVGLLILFFIASIALSALSQLLVLGSFLGASRPDAIAKVMDFSSPMVWINTIISVFTGTWTLAFFSTIYEHLRFDKEGNPAADVAQVFA